MSLQGILNIINRNLHISSQLTNKALTLYKHLLRESEKLPLEPRKYYKFMIKQSYKQHINETDKQRIDQIIQRAYEDADWILKKYLGEKKRQ